MSKVLMVSLLLVAGCAPGNERAMKALRGAGYTDIKLGNYPFFMCGRDDGLNVEFSAKGPSGARVEGAVCCGMLKGCTVRTD